MSEQQKNNLPYTRKLNKTNIEGKNPERKNVNISTKYIRKSATLRSNDHPDILNLNYSKVAKDEKLTSFRKEVGMSKISQNIDKPDTLFGLNEYKEVKKPKTFHSIKKLRNCNSVIDLPDTFEPLKEDYYNLIPRPDSMTKIKNSIKEESKNQEIIKENPIIKKDENNIHVIKDKKVENAIKIKENEENNKENDKFSEKN